MKYKYTWWRHDSDGNDYPATDEHIYGLRWDSEKEARDYFPDAPDNYEVFGFENVEDD